MDFSKIKVEKIESLSKEFFDEIPVLGSNGVPDIDSLHECLSCLADMIEDEKKKNEDRTVGTRSSKRILQNTLDFYTTQICTHNLYLDIAEDVMEVSWPRNTSKWMHDIPVDNSSKTSRKRKSLRPTFFGRRNIFNGR